MSAPAIDPAAPKTVLADTSSNPAPLGLFGFGLSTFLLNVHNAGFFPIDSMILAMAIFYGGLAQVVVGIMEWKKGITFGTVAFSSYGFFWLTLATLIILPKTSLGIAAPTPGAMASYLFIWGLMSAILWYCTFRLNTALNIVFLGVVILFGLLTLANAFHGTTAGHVFHTLAGYEGILTALGAIYTGGAQVVNEYYGEIKWPLNRG
jgi:succinate-acetate transporter protein